MFTKYIFVHKSQRKNFRQTSWTFEKCVDIICASTNEEAIDVRDYIILFIIISAVIYDLKTYHVPNRIILMGYVLSLIYRIYTRGTAGILYFLAGAILPMILLYLLFLIGALGAGDIKLLSVIGSFLSMRTSLLLIGCSFLIGAGMAFIVICLRREFVIRGQYLKQYLTACINSKSFLLYSTMNQQHSYLHFTVCILLAYMMIK